MSLAFAVAGWVMQSDFARKNEPRDLAWEIVGLGLVGGILGARLHQAVYHWPDFVSDPLGFLTGRSGLVWYGGVVGGVIATVWPIRRKGVPYASALDTGALGLAIGLAIGRVGCHLSGDGDWGTPTGLPWGVAYVNGTAGWPYPPGIVVHPAALYEMIALLGIFVLLLRLRARVTPTGALFAIYLLLSGLTRLLVELIRTNPPVLLGLTEAQWTSIVLSGGAALWLWRHRGRARGECEPVQSCVASRSGRYLDRLAESEDRKRSAGAPVCDPLETPRSPRSGEPALRSPQTRQEPHLRTSSPGRRANAGHPQPSPRE
jgi:phosphatidylglycerol:prolipoprotein diacylglycerol transferase